MSREDILSEIELSLMIAVGLRLEDCMILVGQILFAQSVISVGRDERPELRAVYEQSLGKTVHSGGQGVSEHLTRDYSDNKIEKIAEGGGVAALRDYSRDILMIEELVVDSEARFASGEEVGDYLGAVGRGNGVDDLVDIFVAVSVKICGEDSSAEADVEKIYLVVSGRLLDLLDIFVEVRGGVHGAADEVEGEEVDMILADDIGQLLHGDHSVCPVSRVLIHVGERTVFLGLEVVYRVALIVALLDGEEIADGLIDCLGEAAVRLGGEHFYKRPRELFEDDGDKVIRIKDKQRSADAFAVLVEHGLVVLVIEICGRVVDAGNHHDGRMSAVAVMAVRMGSALFCGVGKRINGLCYRRIGRCGCGGCRGAGKRRESHDEREHKGYGRFHLLHSFSPVLNMYCLISYNRQTEGVRAW